MGRRKRRRRKPVDMSIPPHGPARYVAPQHDEEFERESEYEPGVLRHVIARYRRGRLVGFAVTLDLRTGTRWQQLVRIDSAHGEVHEHRYLAGGGEERTVFEVIDARRAEKTLERWLARAATIVENNWYDHVKRWTDGVL